MTKTIEEWMTEAWAERDDCPPPEIFLSVEWEDLTEPARQRATRHLESCPACAAERDLALAFEAEALPNPRSGTEVEALLDRIATTAPAEARSARVLRFPPLTRLVPRRALALAAAALVVVVVAFTVRDRVMAPGLPDLPDDDVMRSAEISIAAPAGDVPTPPTTFDWSEVEGAATYRVTIAGVDEAVVWRGETEAPPFLLSPAVRDLLSARVVYSWRVEAFDASGGRLAWSRPTEFRALAEAHDNVETL